VFKQVDAVKPIRMNRKRYPVGTGGAGRRIAALLATRERRTGQGLNQGVTQGLA